MIKFSKPAHVRSLGYTLEHLFGDALDDQDIANSIEEMIDQMRGSPEYARKIKEDWEKVLDEGDPAIAQDLILNWANQGRSAPAEALDQLQKWYDTFEPLWSDLET